MVALTEEQRIQGEKWLTRTRTEISKLFASGRADPPVGSFQVDETSVSAALRPSGDKGANTYYIGERDVWHGKITIYPAGAT